MAAIRPIILACWGVFVVYWLISARSAKPIQETKGWLRGAGDRLLFLVGLAIMANSRLLAVVGVPAAWLEIRVISRTAIIGILSAVLTVIGLIVAILARTRLAGNWSAVVALKEGHELITTGIYRFIRHPIYTGLLLMLVGTALWEGVLPALAALLLIAAGLLLKLRQEEALMLQHFPAQYMEYRSRTKALIPFVW